MIVIHNKIDNEIQDRYMIRGKRQERTVVKKTSKIDLIYVTRFTEGEFFVCVIGHSFDCHRLILKVYPHLR